MVVPTIVPIVLTVLYKFPLMVSNTLNMYSNHTVMNKPSSSLGQRQWGDDIYFVWELVIIKWTTPSSCFTFLFFALDWISALMTCRPIREVICLLRPGFVLSFWEIQDTLYLYVPACWLRYTYTPVGGYCMKILHVRNRYRESNESIQLPLAQRGCDHCGFHCTLLKITEYTGQKSAKRWQS